MTTSTMNISLPEALKRFVKERVRAARYSNPSDYVRSLIREDQRRVAAEQLLEEMLAKHLEAHPATSPEKPPPMTRTSASIVPIIARVSLTCAIRSNGRPETSVRIIRAPRFK